MEATDIVFLKDDIQIRFTSLFLGINLYRRDLDEEELSLIRFWEKFVENERGIMVEIANGLDSFIENNFSHEEENMPELDSDMIYNYLVKAEICPGIEFFITLYAEQVSQKLQQRAPTGDAMMINYIYNCPNPLCDSYTVDQIRPVCGDDNPAIRKFECPDCFEEMTFCGRE